MADEEPIDSSLDLGLADLLSSQDSFCNIWNEEYTSYTNIDEGQPDSLRIECDRYIIATEGNPDTEALVNSLGENLMQPSQLPLNSMGFPSVNPDGFTAPDSTHTSLIPSNKNWPGEYNFKIAFQEQTEKMTKSTSWTYSETLDKLFINMGVSCMVGFTVDAMPPSGCTIRALPIFDKSDHVIKVVKRCPIHSSPTDPSNVDHKAPEHLIRCDNECAQYPTDSNGRQSVVVPFEGPQAGADNSQYLYRFMCLGSCVGGINRRPLLVIFTLENNGLVLGRRVLRVRICACPGRDRKTEENNISTCKETQQKTQTLAQTTSTDLLVIEPQNKKQRLDEEVYTISVRGRGNYELLMKIKQSLEIADLVPKEIVDNYRQNQQQKQLELSAAPAIAPSLSINGAVLPSTSSSHESSTSITVQKPQLKRAVSTSETVLHRNDKTINHVVETCNESIIKQEPDDSVTSWLTSIGMAAYADFFLKKGLKDVSQLECYSEEDLSSLCIGEAHHAIIWRALQERFGKLTSLSSSQQSTSSGVSSVQSLISGRHPNIIQIARYRFKRVTSLKSNADHE